MHVYTKSRREEDLLDLQSRHLHKQVDHKTPSEGEGTGNEGLGEELSGADVVRGGDGQQHQHAGPHKHQAKDLVQITESTSIKK